MSGGWPLAGLVHCTGNATGDQSQAVAAFDTEGVGGGVQLSSWWDGCHRHDGFDDCAYLIDHTVQIGTVKCFAVVGVRLSQLPYPSRCLQRQDLVLIALTPMQ